MQHKDEQLEKDMLKDVSHADIAKTDDAAIDDTDPDYDYNYDVSGTRKLFHLSALRFYFYFRTSRMNSPRKRKKRRSSKKAKPSRSRLTRSRWRTTNWSTTSTPTMKAKTRKIPTMTRRKT